MDSRVLNSGPEDLPTELFPQPTPPPPPPGCGLLTLLFPPTASSSWQSLGSGIVSKARGSPLMTLCCNTSPHNLPTSKGKLPAIVCSRQHPRYCVHFLHSDPQCKATVTKEDLRSCYHSSKSARLLCLLNSTSQAYKYSRFYHCPQIFKCTNTTDPQEA